MICIILWLLVYVLILNHSELLKNHNNIQADINTIKLSLQDWEIITE